MQSFNPRLHSTWNGLLKLRGNFIALASNEKNVPLWRKELTLLEEPAGENFLQNASMEEDIARLQKNRDLHQHAEYSNRTGNTSVEEETEAFLSSGAKEEVDDGINVGIETLNLLEWPKVCVQVSEFASTPMAVALARAGSLPIGKTLAESEELQAQTAAAQLLSSPLDFSDIADLRGFIEDAQSGNVCQLEELCQVRKTLAAVSRLHHQVIGQFRNGDLMSNQEGDQGFFRLSVDEPIAKDNV